MVGCAGPTFGRLEWRPSLCGGVRRTSFAAGSRYRCLGHPAGVVGDTADQHLAGIAAGFAGDRRVARADPRTFRGVGGVAGPLARIARRAGDFDLDARLDAATVARSREPGSRRGVFLAAVVGWTRRLADRRI